MRSRIDFFAYWTFCLIIAAGFLLSRQPAYAVVYQWNGSQSSDWQNPANWNGGVVPDFDGPPDGETWGHRLEVNQTATREELVYDSSLGTTVYASPSGDPYHGRGLIMGNGVTGVMRITGGTFSTSGSASADLVGHQSAGNGTLIIYGGNYISSNSGLHLGTGGGGTATLTVNSGTATITTLRMNATTATVNLNGGTLQASIVDVRSGTNTINFNGGTLQARRNETGFLEGLDAANVLSGGAVIDTNGFNITIAQDLLDGGGGLTKQGDGVLILSGENTYTSVTTVAQGTLRLGNDSALGTTAGKTVVESGATLDIAGFKAGTGTPGGEWIEVSGGGVGGGGALINSGATQTQAFSNITLLGDTTFGGTGRWDLRDGTFAVGGHTITKVGGNNVSIVRATVTEPGDVDVNGGTFRIEGSTNWNAATPVTIRVAGGTRLDYWATTIAHNQNIEVTGGMVSANSTSSPSLSGTLTLNTGNNTIGVGNEWGSPTLTVTGRITGDGGFALNGRNTAGPGGTGILILTNTGNDYAGDTAVNTGTLRLGAAGVLPDGPGKGNLVLNAGSAAAGTFDLNGFNETVNGLQGTSGAVLGQVVNNAVGTASVLTVGGGNATSAFAGVLRDNTGTGGTLALTKIGTGTLTLSGENTYTGDTNVSQGALRITNPNAMGTGEVTVGDGARLELAGGITVEGQSLTMSGRGGNNIGALQTQSGQNTWAGNVTIGAGETRIGASGAGNTLTISGAIDGGSSSTLAVRNNNGTTILSGENTYGGNTDVVIGLLQIDGGHNRLPVGTVLRMGYTEGSAAASFDLNGWNQEVAGLVSRADTMPLTVTNSSGDASTLTVNSTGTHTYVGGITGNLALTKTGAGTLVLSGENDYTGNTNVDQGVLRVTNPAALGSTAGGTTVAAGAVLELAGGITVADQSLTISSIGTNPAALQSVSGHNTWAGDVTLGRDGTRLAANGAGQSLTINGVIGDDGEGYKLAIRNSGHSSTGDLVVLSGANTYGGDTEVVVGTLQIADGDNRLPTTTVLRVGNSSNVSSATFDLNGRNQQVAGLADAGSTMSRTVTNSSAATPSTLTVANSTDYTYAGVLTGNLALTKMGSSRLTLSGTNTYTGDTNVEEGGLQIANAAALGSTAAGTTVAAGARLELAGGITVAGQSLTISSIGTNPAALQSVSGHNTWAGDVTLGHDGTRIAASGAGQILTIAGAIGDDGNGYRLAIRNSGASSTGDLVVLSGANTYGGDTEVVVGTLQIAGGDNRLPTTTVLRVGNSANVSSATFDLNGRNQQVAGLTDQGSTMSRTVTNSSATPSVLTVNNSTNYTYAGVLTGNLALTKTGAGRLTLGGTNTHTGLTTVDAGTLHVTGSLAHGGSSHVRVASAGTDFGASDPTIIRRVAIGGSFADIGSQVTGPDTFATRADLLAGGNGGSSPLDVGMAWRSVGGADAAALPPLHNLVSDVLRLDGMDDGNGQTDPFVLQMSYDAALLQPNQDGMFLAWLSPADGWVNAVEGNIGIGGSAVANFQAASGGYAAGSWDAFADAYNPIDLDLFVGSWGLDATNQMAWAVLNHNSQFAVMVVPEPSALLLGCMGLLGLLLTVRRRR